MDTGTNFRDLQTRREYIWLLEAEWPYSVERERMANYRTPSQVVLVVIFVAVIVVFSCGCGCFVLCCSCCSVVFERMANFRTPSQVVVAFIFVDVVVVVFCVVVLLFFKGWQTTLLE